MAPVYDTASSHQRRLRSTLKPAMVVDFLASAALLLGCFFRRALLRRRFFLGRRFLGLLSPARSVLAIIAAVGFAFTETREQFKHRCDLLHTGHHLLEFADGVHDAVDASHPVDQSLEVAELGEGEAGFGGFGCGSDRCGGCGCSCRGSSRGGCGYWRDDLRRTCQPFRSVIRRKPGSASG